MMGKEDESEEPFLEEASGYSIAQSNSFTECQFMKCHPKSDVLFYAQEEFNGDESCEESLPSENKHKVLKRIIHNDPGSSPEYTDEASGIVCANDCEHANDLSDFELLGDCDDFGGNQLLVFEDSDGTWRLHWYVTSPENEDDFIALCWEGKIFYLDYYFCLKICFQLAFL